MMIKKSNIWLLVVLSAMMLACKGNKDVQAVETNGEKATGLYDAQNAGRAEVQTAGATMSQKAVITASLKKMEMVISCAF